MVGVAVDLANSRERAVYRGECVFHLLAGLGGGLHHAAEIGIGRSMAGADGIARSYKESLESIRLAQKLKVREGVRPFTDLGLMHWLYHLPADAVDGNPFIDTIYELASHDQRRNTELVKTIEGYLDNGGSLVDTAVKLHIHRNTLVHRLKRIEELCDLDLKNPANRMNLHVAVKYFRLDGNRIPVG